MSGNSRRPTPETSSNAEKVARLVGDRVEQVMKEAIGAAFLLRVA